MDRRASQGSAALDSFVASSLGCALLWIAPSGFEERLSFPNSYLLQPQSTLVPLGKPGEGS